MRIIFAGTPEFAAHILQTLIDTKHTVCAVYTQPDRPAGRGRKLTASPVKHLAIEHHLPIEQPLNFKNNIAQEKLRAYHADLMIVVAYGVLLPQIVLDSPKLGCINVHASLLPRWRGAAPIQRAILAGDSVTGICIMQMDAGLDTGAVLASTSCPILDDDTTQTLHDKLAKMGADTLVATLNNIKALQAIAVPQDNKLACYAAKLSKDEAVIDWQQSANVIFRQIRAFNPWPVAQTKWRDNILRIWTASIVKEVYTVMPGEIIAVGKQGIDVMTKQRALRLTHVQIPGKKVMPVSDFIHAHAPSIGDYLG